MKYAVVGAVCLSVGGLAGRVLTLSTTPAAGPTRSPPSLITVYEPGNDVRPVEPEEFLTARTVVPEFTAASAGTRAMAAGRAGLGLAYLLASAGVDGGDLYRLSRALQPEGATLDLDGACALAQERFPQTPLEVQSFSSAAERLRSIELAVERGELVVAEVSLGESLGFACLPVLGDSDTELFLLYAIDDNGRLDIRALSKWEMVRRHCRTEARRLVRLARADEPPDRQ